MGMGFDRIATIINTPAIILSHADALTGSGSVG